MKLPEKKLPSSEEIQWARKLLGLGRCATLSGIKTAFYNQAKKYHPDKCNQDKQKCEEKMRELNRAYETILLFLANYRYCFDAKPAQEEEWDQWKRRFYEDFII
ncbi:MAG: J domain-containing protein [Candidatus Latescibacteria bacterium]|nr:J domain-containing protein [Candidatus Latescibacterota bacterium]